MKKTILFAIASLGLFSCQKEKEVKPEFDVIEYRVECKSCLFMYENEVWNASNELDRSKKQYLNVYGKASMTYELKMLKKAKLELYDSVLARRDQIAKLEVLRNGKVILKESVQLSALNINHWVFNVDFN